MKGPTTLAMLGVVLVPPASAQMDRLDSRAPAAAFPDPDRLTKLRAAFPAIDRLMRDFAERTHVPGIAYGIIVDGRVAHLGVGGFAMRPPGRPSRARQCSASRP